jgi:hypothetical protein
MIKLLMVLSGIFLCQSLLFIPKAIAAEIAGASACLIDQSIVKNDPRIEQLNRFLEDYKSPLTDYSEDFIKMADKYNIDWKLLVSISGVESTFGKNYILGTYNAYGWGGGKIYFESWEDSIEKVSKALSEKYYNRGLNTPYKIAPVYCPPSKVWAGKVNYFMEKLENTNLSKNMELRSIYTL